MVQRSGKVLFIPAAGGVARLLGLVLGLLLISDGMAQDTVSAEAKTNQTHPFVVKYCVGCHGPQQQKADLRIDQLDPDIVGGKNTDLWQEVLDRINAGEMPPRAAKRQPADAERRAFVKVLTASLREASESKRRTGGQNVLRRLTAYEYNNTLRDLLHLDRQFARDLPPEGVAKEGFKNNNTVLQTSALHLEYFERIARAALERILLAPAERPQPYFVRIEPELAFKQQQPAKQANKARKKKRRKKAGNSFVINGDNFRSGTRVKAPTFRLDHGELAADGKGIVLAGNRAVDQIGDPFAMDKKIGGAQGAGRSGYMPEFRLEMYEVPHDSPVLVRIRAAAVPGPGGSFPRLSFELGSFRGAGVSDQKEAANVEIRNTEPQTYEFIVHGSNFPFQSNKPSRPSYFRIFNEYRRGTSALTYEQLPKLQIDWVEITANYFPQWPSQPCQSILLTTDDSQADDSQNELARAREILARFMPRAYRRPVTEAEVGRKVALFRRLRSQEKSFAATMVSTLTAVLCSPHFLLISEPQPQAAKAGEKQRLDDYQLASRLSYFLWSSMPDETLFQLAAAKKLRQPEVLLAQVRRMLASPKAIQFSTNFASQWLDLAGVRRLAVNPEYFTFKEQTKDLFEQESIQFVHHVLQADLPITNFVDSEFVMLNPALARHYRIPGISGGGFQPHPIANKHHRGGLLTQASMLFGNSTGAETHPIKRGVWVLERILDDPPPPPPPNVPDLPEPEAKDVTKLSLKERLIEHAQVASCRDCHSKIDPWGVPFENYNALGQWREGSRDPLVRAPHQNVKVDPQIELKSGKTIRDLKDLKQHLLTEKKPKFRAALVRKVMAYALGRYLEFADRAAIEEICKNVQQRGDRFQAVIEQVVLSEPFLTK